MSEQYKELREAALASGLRSEFAELMVEFDALVDDNASMFHSLQGETDARLAAENERDALAEDARRYQWLRTRLLGADFAYGDPPESVITFQWPDVPIGADLSACIDAAISSQGK